MEKAKRKARVITEQTVLLPPCTTPNTLIDRDEWIEKTVAGFVSPSPSNKAIYRVLLETLWPKDHGIPGPVVEREELRRAVEDFKGTHYVDVFRRLRELQGEEGLLGIVKQGAKYQLIDTNVYPKRVPRSHLPKDQWDRVLKHYNNVCAACGSPPDEKGFQPDHKVPRLRGGTDAISNWQPLCDSCNNIKSTTCRGCKEDCTKCSWAYPEFYKPVKIAGPVLKLIHQYATAHKVDPNQLVTTWLLDKLKEE